MPSSSKSEETGITDITITSKTPFYTISNHKGGDGYNGEYFYLDKMYDDINGKGYESQTDISIYDSKIEFFAQMNYTMGVDQIEEIGGKKYVSIYLFKTDDYKKLKANFEGVPYPWKFKVKGQYATIGSGDTEASNIILVTEIYDQNGKSIVIHDSIMS
ncbi:MAG: hypothetical protein Q8R66_07825 [Methanobacteriaceae archaeon]|nr:hypothetical protein [Methanobacteriaceae archaeon]